MSMTAGTLYIVSTPIGNLGDISQRALDTLAAVDLVLAEDTRRSGRLLRHYGIRTPLLAVHEHNERALVDKLTRRLQAGEQLALISDAGTPLISDPGFLLVRELIRQGERVVPIPGASAVICALSVAGLPTDRFVFEGFLPARTQGREKRLQQLARETRTLVFYEAPHRVLDTLEALARCFGPGRLATVMRELTKAYETLRHGELQALSAWLAAEPAQQRGEFVIVVAGAPEADDTEEDGAVRETLQLLLEELPLSQAVDLTARLSGVKPNRVYRLALTMRDSKGD